MRRRSDARLGRARSRRRPLWLATKLVVLYLWFSLYVMVTYVLAVFSADSADPPNWSYVAAVVAVTIVCLIVTAVIVRRWLRRYRALFRPNPPAPRGSTAVGGGCAAA